jgi:hypothetical protein
MKALSLFLALGLGSCALAQFSVGEDLSYRGSLEFGVDSTFVAPFLPPAVPIAPQFGLTLAAHLTVEADLEPLRATVVLDPSVRIGNGVPILEPGLTEAYVLWPQSDFDLSAGLERLALETARLSIPFGLEEVDARGLRQGVPGMRLSYYTGDWRVRGAAFYRIPAEQVVPLVSVSRSFGDFELEGHALYAGRAIAGLGGSGLVGDLVLYGEAWLLTDPLEGRGALGLNGYLDVLSWTLEAAYLSPGEGALKDDPDAEPGVAALQVLNQEPRPALLAQLALPLGEAGDMSLSASGGAFFDADAVRGRVGTSFSFLGQEQELTLSALGFIGPEPLALTLGLGVKSYF